MIDIFKHRGGVFFTYFVETSSHLPLKNAGKVNKVIQN